MKRKLQKISNNLNKGRIDEKQAREQLLELLKVNPETLKENKLEIDNHDYCIYQMRQDGQLIHESSELSCHKFAFEIIETNKSKL